MLAGVTADETGYPAVYPVQHQVCQQEVSNVHFCNRYTAIGHEHCNSTNNSKKKENDKTRTFIFPMNQGDLT